RGARDPDRRPRIDARLSLDRMGRAAHAALPWQPRPSDPGRARRGGAACRARRGFPRLRATGRARRARLRERVGCGARRGPGRRAASASRPPPDGRAPADSRTGDPRFPGVALPELVSSPSAPDLTPLPIGFSMLTPSERRILVALLAWLASGILLDAV